MHNNTQAEALKSIFCTNFLESQEIDISKEELKSIKSNTLIKIDATKLKLFVVNGSLRFSKCYLKYKDGYFFVEFSSSKKGKKYEQKALKKSFKLKIYKNLSFIEESNFLLSKEPLRAFISNGKRDFAKVDIYFDKHFYLEVKELL